jgi:tungstate transport system ATP-binding protein
VIELVGITKKYGPRIILDIPRLSFEEGRRYALIGVNGSGKTTLLRLLAGTLLPDSGEIRHISRDDMGYMPQSPYAFSFSVQKNVEIALSNYSNPESLAHKALKAVGMSDLAHARGNRLSGGETQRMAFARMIARPRKLLLLDEPTSSTDIRGTDQIEKNLLRYAAETNCTVILSTHSPAQALRLAEQVIYLDQGKVVENGPAEAILHSPQKESTRLFLQHWKI